MTNRIVIERPRGESPWPFVALVAFLALVGISTVLSTLGERPGDLIGLGVKGWVGILALPLVLGVLAPLAWTAVVPRTPRQRRIWRGVQGLVVAGLVAGGFALVGGHLFTATNRNLLAFGSLLVGIACGLTLSRWWDGPPAAAPLHRRRPGSR